MKISLNWLKKYVTIPAEVSNEDLIRLIGARLVEVEGVIDETHKYDNIYVVKVEKAEKIPETHLTLCQVNDGGAESIQVVCGAPNVREGMLAAWIKPGAIVPASVNEDAPFVIGKRKMLGKYESNGMLAGADELDFGDDHSGIVEIDPEMAKPGDLLADIFELNDLILEIENKSLTHRPDCFGIIGFSREVHGILEISEPFPFVRGLELEKSHTLDSRENRPTGEPLGVVKNIDFSNSNLKIILTKENGSDICQRYTAVVLEKHGELKKKYLTWQDTILSKSGMKPISPIVDATNYLMLLTGQPLHAFDYDKFIAVGKSETPIIKVRLAKNGEKLTLLDDTEIELNENDIVITSNDVPVALAGAMGGKSTEITEDTKNIILESATFSLYNLRKTQMSHGIFTEAITRFTKGQPPYQTLDVALSCAGMLSDGFEVTSLADEYPNPEKDIVVKITTVEINALLGTSYNDELIARTLKNVGFKVDQDGDSLVVTAPKWRTDIHIMEDIIEEVGRLLGYDNIIPTLPLHLSAEKNKLFEIKRMIRNELASLGANEVLTYSFVSERLLEKADLDIRNSYKIVNSISPDLQLVRQSLIPSLLDKTYINEKLPVDEFAIFEMNKVYQKAWGLNDEKVPVERNELGFIVAERKNDETAFYKAKKYVKKLFDEFNIAVTFSPLKNNEVISKPFETKRAAEIRLRDDPEVLVGVVGEFKNSVRNDFKLAKYLAGFEINLDIVLEKYGKTKILRFGKRKYEDLTVTTSKTYDETLAEVEEKYPDAIIHPLSIYQAEGQDTKNISFRIESISK
ncbi:phenylalanine--tRNA ligase subunit beta [Candidatus Saccharibacteria bacterium]|nr:phenylalanine--tRNA ligase subunit beta [Candidatus Saccharibacteria bacterium]